MDVPALYRIWFERYRRQKGGRPRLPSPLDSLYLDGFPRSGNTYFSRAVQEMFPSLEFAHHLHCLAPLRIALKYRTPTFVLMRNPKSAIASRVLQITSAPGSMMKLSIEEIALRLEDDWRRYYCFCERNMDDLSLIAFEDAVASPYATLSHIAKRVGLPENTEDERSFLKFHRRFTEHDREKRQGSTSLPDAKRNRDKETIFPLIEQSVEYDKTVSIYHRLRSQSVLIN